MRRFWARVRFKLQILNEYRGNYIFAPRAKKKLICYYDNVNKLIVNPPTGYRMIGMSRSDGDYHSEKHDFRFPPKTTDNHVIINQRFAGEFVIIIKCEAINKLRNSISVDAAQSCVDNRGILFVLVVNIRWPLMSVVCSPDGLLRNNQNSTRSRRTEKRFWKKLTTGRILMQILFIEMQYSICINYSADKQLYTL